MEVMNKQRYCVIDIETSGYSEKYHAITQIAAIVFDEEYNILAEFNVYIKPYDKSYDKKAEAITGLTKEFLLENGKDLGWSLYDLQTFIIDNKVDHLVGHKIRTFDNKFLVKSFMQIGTNKAIWYKCFSVYDTMEMSWLTSGVKSHSLEALCKKYNIVNEKAHDALSDCKATIELFKILKK